MTIRSLLSAYLHQQQDLGSGDLFLSHGFDLKRFFPQSSPAVNSTPPQTAHVKSIPATTAPTVAVKPQHPQFLKAAAPEGKGAFSKLARIKPVEAYNVSTVRNSSFPVSLSKRDLLKNLYFDVLKCTECKLGGEGKKLVFGSGSAEGTLMIIGDSPGVEDEKLGLPFKGENEEFFEKMLRAMKLNRNKDVFVTHVLKCRVPQDQVPQKHEIQACRFILDRQLDIIAPRAILVFGERAANTLLERNDLIEDLRKEIHYYKGMPLVVTYKIDLLPDNQKLKAAAWADLKKIMAILSSDGTYDV